MNYYLLGLVPPAAIFAALPIFKLLEMMKQKTRFFTIGIFVLCYLAFSFRYSYGAAYRTPAQDQSVLEAAFYIQKHSQPTDFIIASHGTNTDLLYYSERKGWAFPIVGYEEPPYARFTLRKDGLEENKLEFLEIQHNPILRLEYYKRMGAKYFVCAAPNDLKTAPEFLDYLNSKYQIIQATPSFVVYQLF